MGWTNRMWKREADAGTVVGLDLTAGRARAVYGPPGEASPRPLPLDDADRDLSLAISLENRTPTVGGAAAGLVRKSPHLVCRNYLSALGQAREWRAARHRLDPAVAVGLLAQRLRQPLTGQQGVAVAVPAYLSIPQVKQLTAALELVKLPILGTITAPLAVAANHVGDDIGTALIADADDHAITWSVLTIDGERVRVLATVTQPAVGVSVWFDRMLDGISDRCVRLCRRDPRDSATAEQAVYEQIDHLLSGPDTARPIVLQVRTTQWYQEMTLAADEFEQFCNSLSRQAVDGMRQALTQAHAAVPAMAPPDVLWLTAEAARLPGLIAAVTQNLPEPTAIRPLPADAVPNAAHALADRWIRRELPRGHVEAFVNVAGNRRPIGIAKPQAARPV